MHVDLSELKTLLAHLKSLPQPNKAELNLFSIGARGHYENPISDLLAFFIDPDAGHDLSTLVLEAFMECLPGTYDVALSSQPSREVMTATGSRIDILLESEEWVLALENKIWHQQNNPFADYREHLKLKHPNKSHLLVVLSPEGTAPSGWSGVSYRQFLAVLSPKLGMAYVESPLNKWLILLREFMLHLESLMGKNVVASETEAFVLENLHNIQELILLKNTVVKSFQEECLRFLSEYFSDKDYEVSTALNHWEGYPALRFGLSHWQSPSDVVLFLNRTPGKRMEIRTYACDLTTTALREKAKQMLMSLESDNCWDERGGKILGITSYIDVSTDNKQLLFTKVAEGIRLLDEFEGSAK
jgi:hypothetical protein